jgi:hypothetical protein
MGKITDKGIPEGIADLQCETEEHGINKEDEHLSAPEQHEGIQPQGGKKTWFGPCPHRKTGRQVNA